MFLSPRVPTLCDFEPLHLHVEMLKQLVLASQAASVDEMSQTITDLLSEQRVITNYSGIWNGSYLKAQ